MRVVNNLAIQRQETINPATERPAGQITLCTAADVDRAAAAARKAFISFSRSSR
jgi:aldehyde dehydrogenase (NAD+)